MRRAIIALAAVLVVYYAVPVGEAPSVVGIVVSVVGLLGGMAVLVYLTIRQVRRLAGARPDDEGIRIESLIFLIYIVVPMFAFGYFVLETADPGQFDSLETKTDALYFTVSTLATVGFGLSTNVYLSLACLFLTGAFDSISMVIRATLEQMITPDRLRGRVLAVEYMFIGFSNEFGAFESGATAALFGPIASVVGGGFATLLVVVVVRTIWPELARIGPLHTLAPADDTVPGARPPVPG